MTEIILTKPTSPPNGSTEWQAMSAAILRASKIASLDELLHQALNVWLSQLAPELRWQIAVDLYQDEEVSLGRAAEIADLNTIVFMEKLRHKGIPLVAAQSTTSQQEKRKSLIYAGFNLPR